MTDSRATTVGAVIGAGPIIAGTRSHSSHVTNLAQQLAPPRAPQRASTAIFGVIMVLVAIGVVGLGGQGMRPTNPPSDRELGAVWMAAGVVLLAVVLLGIFLQSRKDQRRYEAHRSVWPAYMYVWQNAMVCLRCFGAFFPASALPAGFDPGVLIPVGSFRSAVTDIGARLAEAGLLT